MTTPNTPKPDDHGQPESDQDKPSESSSLDFSDIMPEKHDSFSVADKNIQSSFPKPTFSYGPQGLPQFFMRKSDFTAAVEKPIHEVKELVDKFLQETPEPQKHQLTPAEISELLQTRESLARFSSASDALSNTLKLAQLYQHARYIEDAKKATNLSLGIDPDNHLGQELFKELEHMHPPDIVISPRTTTHAVLSKTNLRKCIERLSNGKVIVVGDLLIDELLEGAPERISREAPVLILEHVDTELIPGGAANTANNLASLGGKCHAIGVCGTDDYAYKLAHLFDKAQIEHSLVHDNSRPTTVKTRILSKSHSFKQQLLRLDRICHDPVSHLIEDILIDKIKQVAGSYRAMILSDYRGGVMTPGLISACQKIAKDHDLMVIVDAQENFNRFKNVTLMTPNQPDTERVVGFVIDSSEALSKAGKQLLEITSSKAILITRGDQGMVLFEQGEEMVELPTFNKSEVFDVSGAGDTVAATMALALVTGANFIEAMALGNLAAGIVVKKPGTAVTTQKEMLADLETLDLPD